MDEFYNLTFNSILLEAIKALVFVLIGILIYRVIEGSNRKNHKW